MLKTGAGNETRTRDPDLGKVVLYQLSYSRLGPTKGSFVEREFSGSPTDCQARVKRRVRRDARHRLAFSSGQAARR